jgi:hypothetical protein
VKVLVSATNRFGLCQPFVNGRKLARLFGVVRHPDCATRQKNGQKDAHFFWTRTVLADIPE